WTQQSWIEHIRAVGGSQNDDTLALFEAVHLYQYLVQGLLTLVVPTTHATTTAAADGVDLIDEYNAWSVLLGLSKQVADTAGTDTYEHFYEFRTGDAEERYVGLTSNGPSQHRLTGTRRADQ